MRQKKTRRNDPSKAGNGIIPSAIALGTRKGRATQVVNHGGRRKKKTQAKKVRRSLALAGGQKDQRGPLFERGRCGRIGVRVFGLLGEGAKIPGRGPVGKKRETARAYRKRSNPEFAESGKGLRGGMSKKKRAFPGSADHSRGFANTNGRGGDNGVGKVVSVRIWGGGGQG